MLDRTVPSISCIVCRERALRPLLEKGGQRYCQCENCGHIAMDPLPDLGDQEAFYKKQYAEGVYKDYMNARPLKLRTFNRRLDAILGQVPARPVAVGSTPGAWSRFPTRWRVRRIH